MASSTPAGGARVLRAAVLAALLVTAAVVRSADPHAYHEGNYGTAGLPHADLSGSRSSWDYSNLNEWPELCRTGSRQSPISFSNVDPSEVVKDAPLKRLQFSSKCFFPKDETQMRIVNEGAVNMVSFERQGRLPEDLSECTVIDPLNKNRTFYFSELHFHATSEHKFRNLRPDVEMHLSFTTDEVKEKNREVLMVAVMLKASTSINSTSVRALRHILVDGSLPRRHAMTTCFLTEDLSITSLLPARESYLLYDGSETHPPCRENVRWVVMSSPILISRVAVGKLRDAMDQLLPNDFHRFGNARPPQALNGRRIYRFDDTSVPQGGRRSEGNLDDAWTRRDRQNAGGVMNGTVEDDIFRAVTDEANESDEFDIEAYGDDVKSVLPRTTTSTMAPSTNETADEANSTDAADATTEPPTDALEEGTTTAAPAGEEAATTHRPHNTTTTSEAPEVDNATATSSETEAPWSNSTNEPSPSAEPRATENETSSGAPEPTAAGEASAEGNSMSTSTTATTTTTSTTTTATTSTTKKPAAGKGKKGHGSASKNASEVPSDSDAVGHLESYANATATSAWTRLKSFATSAVSVTSAYVKQHPGRAALILLCNIVLLFLFCTCIRGWQRPVYVVGIDPRELQPLNPNPAFGQYGGTSAAAVRSSNQRAE